MISNDEASARGTIEEISVPIVEEKVEVRKVQTEGRSISVETTVVNKNHLVNETLVKENVEICRVPRNEVVSECPPVREEDGLTIIPVLEERLVLKKELVLVEEIHLKRHTYEEEFSKSVPLRSTVVSVTENKAKHVGDDG